MYKREDTRNWLENNYKAFKPYSFRENYGFRENFKNPENSSFRENLKRTENYSFRESSKNLEKSSFKENSNNPENSNTWKNLNVTENSGFKETLNEADNQGFFLKNFKLVIFILLKNYSCQISLNINKTGIVKVIMKGKLFQRCTHLLYCSVLSLGGM